MRLNPVFSLPSPPLFLCDCIANEPLKSCSSFETLAVNSFD